MQAQDGFCGRRAAQNSEDGRRALILTSKPTKPSANNESVCSQMKDAIVCRWLINEQVTCGSCLLSGLVPNLQNCRKNDSGWTYCWHCMHALWLSADLLREIPPAVLHALKRCNMCWKGIALFWLRPVLWYLFPGRAHLKSNWCEAVAYYSNCHQCDEKVWQDFRCNLAFVPGSAPDVALLFLAS